MSEETPDENERNPFTKRGFIASAALVVALIAAVVVIAVLPGGSDEPEAGQSTAPTESATSTPATQAGTEESVCGLPGNEDTALGTAPETDWELVGTFAAPTSAEQYGPGTVSGGVRSCFSHDVTGALFAAANIAALATTGKEEAIYRELSVPSAAQEQALEGASSSPVTGDLSVQIAGFQIMSYSEESAVIRLGIHGSNGVNLSYPVPLEWYEGDWKLVVPPTGDLGVREISGFSEFISWSGA